MLLEEAESEGDEEAVKDLNKIYTSGHHLLKLVNEVLDLSKIDAGMMGVFNEKVNICDPVRLSVDEFRPMASKKNNIIDIEVEVGISTVVIDQQNVQQILFQVIENAVKFTQSGVISVHPTGQTLPATG